jgi:hypothetical protein
MLLNKIGLWVQISDANATSKSKILPQKVSVTNEGHTSGHQGCKSSPHTLLRKTLFFGNDGTTWRIISRLCIQQKVSQ